MKLFRFELEGEARHGALRDAELALIEGDIFTGFRETEARVKLADVTLLSPVTPTKVVALGLNYRDHAVEMGLAIPEEPVMFLKPATSVIGPGQAIEYPGGGLTQRVDYEAELGVVIKKRCRRVSADRAYDYILGYTCVNDVTARDLQIKDGQWSRAKGFDTFCPVGPCIETELDPSELKVEAVLNGRTVQSSTTAELIFPVPKLVEMISRVMTLLPGDIISTGTPPGIGPMKPGDSVTVFVEGVGRLTNPVRKADE